MSLLLRRPPSREAYPGDVWATVRLWINMFIMINQNCSFNILRHNGLTSNLVTSGGPKHVHKVRLRPNGQNYLANVLVWDWFSRLFTNTRVTGRAPDPLTSIKIKR